MEMDREDVKTDAYKTEAKRWTKTNDDPEAYASESKWGLARMKDKWLLFAILSHVAMKQIDECSAKEETPPYLWARKNISKWEEKRKTARWDERTIGKRKPGEEGVNGGRSIPMQTINVEKMKKEVFKIPEGK